MAGVKVPTSVYHLTDLVNLRSIIEQAAVLSTNEMAGAGVPFKDISDRGIQRQRDGRAVPCGPGGTLHDYVPMFFGLRSPMLYKIHKGGVEGATQEPLVHLVSTVQAVEASGSPFVFTDGHAIMVPLTAYFTDTTDLDKLSWEILRGKWWDDTIDHPDRKRRRQAEFLVHGRLDWELVAEIAVRSGTVKEQVEELLDGLAPTHRPDVRVEPTWYY